MSFSIEIIISVARDFIETPSKMLEHWYGSPFVFIDYDYLSYSIPLLGAGNPRFLRNFESLQDKGAALWRDHSEIIQRWLLSEIRVFEVILITLSSSRYVNIGLSFTRELLLVKFDLNVHMDQDIYKIRKYQIQGPPE